MSLNGIDVAKNVQIAIWNFENVYGIHPNRIIMGYALADALASEYQIMYVCEDNTLSMTFHGIPVEINKTNPTVLSVGYMEDTVF